MTEGTVCVIFGNDRILLKLSTRGISEGRWNFLGGKIESNETAEECMKREVREEGGLKILQSFYHGALDFSFENNALPNWRVHVFSSHIYLDIDKIVDTPEGKLRWYRIDGSIPYGDMLPADRFWVPYVFQKKKFSGRFLYNSDVSKVLDYSLSEQK